jgi:peptide/nickel transport system substrate-binding protein
LLVRQDPERIKMCELLKTNLDQIGIICNIAPMEATVLQQRMLDHNFQAAFAGWSTGADPDTAENIWGTGEERNFVQYSNTEVDKLFELGRKEFDREKRGEIYGRMHEIIYEDQPYTFLYYRQSFYGFNKELRGINFSPRGPYHYTPGMSGIWKVVN